MKLFSKFLSAAFLGLALFANDSQAQRDIGAQRLELDNGAGQTITLQTPAGGWTGNIPFVIPIPPPGNPSSGFTYAGTTANQILSWVAPNTVGPAPNNYAGGEQGSWQPISTAALNIVTGTGTANTLPKWTGLNTQGNSLLTDNGTLLTYSGATGFNISGTTNMVAATVSSGLNITGGTLLMGGVTVLNQTRDLSNIGNLSLSGSIGTATTITSSGAITGGSLTTAGTAQASIVNATTGFRLNNTAASGQYLRGNGTNIVLSALNGADLTAGTVPVGAINATGTPSATTFLRGNGTWAAPTGPGIAVAWGVYNPATNTLISSYNISSHGVGGGPFYYFQITGGGAFTNYVVQADWYGGVGSSLFAVEGNIVGWADGGGTYAYVANYDEETDTQITPASFFSFVVYAY